MKLADIVFYLSNWYFPGCLEVILDFLYLSYHGFKAGSAWSLNTREQGAQINQIISPESVAIVKHFKSMTFICQARVFEGSRDSRVCQEKVGFLAASPRHRGSLTFCFLPLCLLWACSEMALSYILVREC